ncbi:DUF4403 family protein [Larkinella sp. VNQ87]|uniref:DUF4403 family protein n=1 Tax=Larkinella sp. VNQ87 TaxID=3400921 RepID=UPI003BFF9F5C
MNLPTLIRTAVGLLTVLLLTHCQKPNPQPPKAEGFDPPIPADTSYLAGPIAFTLKELETKINQELDPVLVGKGSSGGKAGGLFPFRVVRSGPVRVQYANNQIRLSAPLQLFITTPFSSAKVPDQKPFCALDVNFQSPLTVTEDWRLASRIQFVDYQWIEEPEIKFLGKEISLTRFAQNILDRHQSSIEKAIDSAIYKELRLDQLIQPVWKSIQQPLLIDRSYGLWLIPKPLRVEASPVHGNRERLTTHLRIAFTTSTKLQAQKPQPENVPLPVLQKREQLPQMSDLRLLSTIPYADINRMIARSLTDKNRKVLLGALTIKKATVYGGQKALIIKTEVGGLLDGTLYLRGRPSFDTTTNTLRVQNLDFDPGTVRTLARIPGSLVHDGLVKILESFLTVSLGGEIEMIPHQISQSFHQGETGRKTRLDIQSFRFTPQKVAIRPDGIQALIRVQSKVAVQVKQL